jgi:hypothetical protein
MVGDAADRQPTGDFAHGLVRTLLQGLLVPENGPDIPKLTR